MKEKVKRELQKQAIRELASPTGKRPASKRHSSEILNPLPVATVFMRLQFGFLDSHES